MEVRRQMLESYLRRAGFYYASLIKRFEYDNPMISTLVERWRPETHTFHLPWGECTITLEDVAMQVGLPIDSEPVNGTLRSWSKFHQRDIWQWCEEFLGEVLDGHVGTTKYNIKLKWLRSRLQQMPFDSPEEALVRWAGKRGKNDYAEQRLQRHWLRLDNLKVDEFVWMHVFCRGCLRTFLVLRMGISIRRSCHLFCSAGSRLLTSIESCGNLAANKVHRTLH
ncbi:protein MAIN-LIKE 2-like isoform X2 [Arachis stenosperma]|nr:protein MAIN-LIKE 2-like isoform X2 [Arachis stenosperma]